MSMRYYANFQANNGTTFSQPIESENKNDLIKTIRSVAEAERFSGNTCSWKVWYDDYKTYKTRASICVASGGVARNGKRYRDKLPKGGELMY